MKEGSKGVPNRETWLAENLSSGSVVGVDPFLMTISDWNRINSKLAENSMSLKAIPENLVDKARIQKLKHG